MDRYDKQFFDYIAEGAQSSARVVVPLVTKWLTVNSVLDVGCGQGAWLSVWRENGVDQIFGIDGEYVDRGSLLIPPETFQAVNLAQAFELGRRFDLVTCLEVAEHLASAHADRLVRDLCTHADHVLFSAAAPGQGGANHVNERPYRYWKVLFARNGFNMLDCVRLEIRDDARVKPWYRYNTFLYVREEYVDALPARVKIKTLGPDVEPSDISPFWYKLRKSVVRQLPLSMVNRVAALNERWTRL
jgi:SAM-dependent methyltransferase